MQFISELEKLRVRMPNMKKFTVLFLFALITFGMWLPSESTVEAQWRKGGKSSGKIFRTNRGRRHNGSWYGYKNYGQYRRTQVGNRRFRMRRQYYYRNGIRLSRFVRVYY
jgi:hypothetical protein